MNVDRKNASGGKSLTLKRLTIPVVLLLGMALLTTGCNRDPKKRAADLYQKALAARQANKLEEATIDLTKAIQLDPKLTAAHWELARTLFDRSMIAESLQEVRVVLKAEPQHHQARTLLAQIALIAGDPETAKRTAAAVLAEFPDDRTAAYVEAEGAFSLGETDRALSLFQDLLKTNANEARVHLDIAAVRIRKQQFAEAGQSLRTAWDLDPKDLSAPIALSRLYTAQGDLASAEVILKEAVARSKDDMRPKYLLGTFYLEHQRLSEAETLFRDLASNAGDNAQQRGLLAAFFMATNRPQDAENELKQIIANHHDDWLSKRRLAELYLATKRQPEAAQIVNSLVTDHGRDYQVLLLKARVEMESNEADKALDTLRQAQKVDPSQPLTYYHLARVLLSRGKPQEARQALSDALERAPKFAQARLLLAQLEMAEGKADQAISNLNEAMNGNSQAVAPNLLLSQAYAMKGELDKADRQLVQSLDVAQTGADKAALLRTQGWIKLRQAKYTDAIANATKAMEMDPNSVEGLYLLATAWASQKKPEKAFQSVSAHVAQHPWEAGYLALGDIGLAVKDGPGAKKAFSEALKLNPNQNLAVLGIAHAEALMGEKKEAIASFQDVLKKDPDNALAHFRLGQMLESNGDWQGAIAEYERAIKMDKNPVAKNNLAWLYSEHGGNLDVALKLAQEAKEALPDDPHVADTYGTIALKKGAYETAAQALKEALAKMPQNAVFHYHLAQAYYNLGRLNEARDHARISLGTPSFPDANGARELLAKINSAKPQNR